jgi:hypothetical protein
VSSGFALRYLYLPIHYAMQSKSLLFASVDVATNIWRSEIHLNNIYKFLAYILRNTSPFHYK